MGATVYEGLLVGALVIAVGFALLPAVTPTLTPGAAGASDSRSLYVMSSAARVLSAIVTVAVGAAYCGWFWSGGRRTLAMKTWRLTLRTPAGDILSVRRALARFLACWVGPTLAIGAFAALRPVGQGEWATALLAFNYVWALFDADRQFLQDRIAGTRLLRDASLRP